MSARRCSAAVIGAGLAGIATAHALAARQGRRDVLLVDAAQPMALTSAQSGDNYRDWWPHPVMRRFVGRSIDLMERIAEASDNRIMMTRRGYALCTRRAEIDDLLAGLARSYGAEADAPIRLHARGSSAYRSTESDWRGAPEGVDVITDRAVIDSAFPGLDPTITAVLHVRRGGDISGQQLGQHLLEQYREAGGARLVGRVAGIMRAGGFRLEIDGAKDVRCDEIVIAAGPFVAELAAMLGAALPVRTVLQQKLAFEDSRGAIPTDRPFCIDLDGQRIDWSDEERAFVAEDMALARYAEAMPGGIHCRPERGAGARWLRLGWAFNRSDAPPCREPTLDPQFPEIVLRGAARLQPALRRYYGALPRARRHYGGYYAMTEENWPLIGPLGVDGAYVVGALSGFGTMAACAAGALCAEWMCGDEMDDDARALSPLRLSDSALLGDLRAGADKGVL